MMPIIMSSRKWFNKTNLDLLSMNTVILCNSIFEKLELK